MSAWAVKDKEKTWDAVFDRAWAGEPQFISRGDSQTVVVITLNAYQKARNNGKPDFMRFAGTLSTEDAKQMTELVNNADFSKVDEEIWK